MEELLEIRNGYFKFVFGDFKISRDLLRFLINLVFDSTLRALFTHRGFDPQKILV